MRCQIKEDLNIVFVLLKSHYTSLNRLHLVTFSNIVLKLATCVLSYC